MATHSKSISVDEDIFDFVTMYADEHKISKKDTMSLMFKELTQPKFQDSAVSFTNWFNDYKNGYFEDERKSRELDRMLDKGN